MRTKGATQKKMITLLGGTAYALSLGSGLAQFCTYEVVSVRCSPGSPPAKHKHTCDCWWVPTDTGWAEICSYGYDTYRNSAGHFNSCLLNQPSPSYTYRGPLVSKVCSYTQYKTDGCTGQVTSSAMTVSPVNGFNCSGACSF